jgi:uncharacterized protein (TIGR01777 family)
MKMKTILISGSTGFLGTHLVNHLKDSYEIIGLGSKEINDEWHLEEILKKHENQNIHAVIHLAGANVFAKPWTDSYKKELLESRVHSIQRIHKVLNHWNINPEMVIGASAIGYYGNECKMADESSPAGNDFLASICAEWEKAYHENVKNIPLTILRLGVVTHPSGGALKTMLFPFGWGAMFLPAGGNFPFNFIAVESVVEFIKKILQKEVSPGVYNLVSSKQHTYKSFIADYKLPFFPFIPVPRFLLRIFLGERADLLITPTRVTSIKYTFD